MSEGRGEIELYNQWFQVADLDKDGVLSGGEAVQFFQKSGLPRSPTLFKIWQYVAGDRPSLTRQEFYTAMKLVSAAQRQQGVLEDSTASLIVNGLAGAVPPPQMQGLEVPLSLVPGGGGDADPEGRQRHVDAARGGYPVLGNEKAMSYQTAFDQLDLDGDGLVKGGECFGAFMQSGLSKGQLKLIWDVVAGNEGSLNRHQFIQCLYLIDCAKMNIAIPTVLPEGQFPPMEQVAGLQSMMEKPQMDVYSGLQVGPMPPKAEYVAPQSTGVQFTSILAPKPSDSALHMLSEAEKTQIEMERKMAEQKERDLQRLEEERAAVAARQEFYTNALADIRMSQSKIARNMVEAEQRLEMEKKECSDMELQYDAAYAEFNSQHARVGPMLKALEAVEAEKAALSSKRAALESAIKKLENYDPDWESKEKGECEALRLEISELVAKHSAVEKSTEAMKNRRDTMISIISGLKGTIESLQGEVEVLEKETSELDAEVMKEGDTVVTLLKRVAPVYTTLYNAARDSLIPLPSDALVSTTSKATASPFKYDPCKFGAYKGDWHVFDEEEFSITTVIPMDDRLNTFISPSVRKIEGEEKEMEEDAAEESTEVVMEEQTEGQEDITSPEAPEEASMEEEKDEEKQEENEEGKEEEIDESSEKAARDERSIDNPVFEEINDTSEIRTDP